MWILIVISLLSGSTGGSASVTPIEFPTRDGCEIARKAVIHESPIGVFGGGIKAICVEKK